MISFTVLTSDAAGVCLLGKKGSTGLRFATLVLVAQRRMVPEEKGVRDEG